MRLAKTFCWLAALAVAGFSAPRSWAFAVIGPFDAYQTPVIYYQVGGDIGGPMNLGEEYRRNTPVLYYTYDANFMDYFGSNGVYAVDQAFALLNSLTNVSYYSSDLSEFPLEAQAHNYRAQALELLDLKSAALGLLVEQLGLTEAERYVWCLHDREPGNACPVTCVYTVIKRNFDPVFTPTDQLQPSSYVNGTLYSYYIFEICQGSPYLADAMEFPVDPLANTYTSVASWSYGFDFGGYYTGLTRDDMGGLRYLLRTNNMNIEPAGPDTLTIVTNTRATQLLVSSNLTLFAAQGLTNDAVALAALYPGLAILDTQNVFTNVVTTNVFAYYTNLPWSPATAPASLVVVTNYSTNVANYYQHTFANVVTNTYYTNGVVSVLRSNVGPATWGIPGTLYTNVTLRSQPVGLIMGDFFILPTNSNCGFSIIRTQLVSVLTSTNTPISATNAPQITNLFQQQYSESVVYYFTNYAFVINPVACESNSVALRQGIEKITFVRRDYDSLLERYFAPLTNEYVLNAVTNSTVKPQRIRREVLYPDFLITAQDGATTTADPAIGAGATFRNITFSTNTYPGLAGPGTIVTPGGGRAFVFNKVGPIFLNQFTDFFLGTTYISEEAYQTQLLIWGSFDGSTNAPIVYPNGTDILNLEQQVFIQITPLYLPEGHLTTNILVNTTWYSAELNASSQTANFVPPYTWSLTPGTTALPPGLTLTSTNSVGLISGTPTTEGFYDFSVRVTDSLGRTVDRSYFIKITP